MSTGTKSSEHRLALRHDFTAKLRQPTLFPRVAEYVQWQRELRRARAGGKESDPPMPDWAPLSINLDLTTACNYRCDHCIDWDILNSKVKYDFEHLLSSLSEMAQRGMRSVILIGGGEPTLHPGFARTVRHLKELGVQVAIVSNGSRNDRIFEIFDCLDEFDWVRLSLDAGSDDVFRRMHRPVNPKITLDEICSWVPRLRELNPAPQVGFSFVITWEGAARDDSTKVVANIDEILTATRRARDARFSYISLKPFLTRIDSGAEVMSPESCEDELPLIITRLREAVEEAKTLASADFRVIESINLMLLEKGNWRDFTRQPSTCHMQVFRQVLSPLGLFNCPAHRGVSKARITGRDAYHDLAAIGETSRATAAILDRFDASRECAEVTCLYNSVNWWIEKAITGELGAEAFQALAERFDYFL